MSVCPSVTLTYRGRIGWNSSKIILRLVSLVVRSLSIPQHHGATQREHLEISTGIGVARVGHGKGGFQRTKAVISLKRGKIGPRLLLRTNRKSRIRAFLWCQNLRPLVTLKGLKGHYALCFKTRASFGAHCENLNEDRSILSATNM